MSDTPIADALKKIDELAPNELRASLTADETQAAAALDVSREFGRGWTAGLHAEYGVAMADHHARWALAAGATKRWK